MIGDVLDTNTRPASETAQQKRNEPIGMQQNMGCGPQNTDYQTHKRASKKLRNTSIKWTLAQDILG